jgi:Ca2+-binding EF-hand superfamily protein
MDSAKKTQLFELFKQHDKEKTGLLEEKELLKAIKESNIELHLSHDELDNLMECTEKNHKGQVSYENFLHLL